MEYIIILLSLLGPVEPEKYEYRFDDNSRERVESLFPYIKQAEKNTKVPAKYILGIIYNETNAHADIIGDNGRSYGLGQIYCAVWIDELRKEFGHQNYPHCYELLKPEKNIYAIAFVLSYIKNHYDISWKESVEVYNTGTVGQENEIYQKRSLYFANLFEQRYKLWKKL